MKTYSCDIKSITIPVSVDSKKTQWDTVLTMTRTAKDKVATVAGIVRSFPTGKTAKDAIDVMPKDNKHVFVMGVAGKSEATIANAANGDKFTITVYYAVNYDNAKDAWIPVLTK